MGEKPANGAVLKVVSWSFFSGLVASFFSLVGIYFEWFFGPFGPVFIFFDETLSLLTITQIILVSNMGGGFWVVLGLLFIRNIVKHGLKEGQKRWADDLGTYHGESFSALATLSNRTLGRPVSQNGALHHLDRPEENRVTGPVHTQASHDPPYRLACLPDDPRRPGLGPPYGGGKRAGWCN